MHAMVKRLSEGGLKTAIIAGAVALLVAGTTVVAATPFLKKEKYKKKEGIFVTSNDGPVDLPNQPGTIASLELARGKYAINAKLFNHLAGQPDTIVQTVTCRLHVGDTTLDETKVNQDTKFTSAALQGVHLFGAAGTVELRCGDGGPGANTIAARSIKITAIRARKGTSTPP
jgi:hypothetical protein